MIDVSCTTGLDLLGCIILNRAQDFKNLHVVHIQLFKQFWLDHNTTTNVDQSPMITPDFFQTEIQILTNLKICQQQTGF